MPDEKQYAEQKFAHGFGRRAAFGCCAACGEALQEITALVCKDCRRQWIHEPRFSEREAGHRERITDLFRGVKDSSLTFEKANALFAKRRKAKELKAA